MRQSSLDRFFAASKRAAPSDEVDMESLQSLKDYLDVESIEHDSSMALTHLQMPVTRRKRRRARERGEKPKKPKHWMPAARGSLRAF